MFYCPGGGQEQPLSNSDSDFNSNSNSNSSSSSAAAASSSSRHHPLPPIIRFPLARLKSAPVNLARAFLVSFYLFT